MFAYLILALTLGAASSASTGDTDGDTVAASWAQLIELEQRGQWDKAFMHRWALWPKIRDGAESGHQDMDGLPSVENMNRHLMYLAVLEEAVKLATNGSSDTAAAALESLARLEPSSPDEQLLVLRAMELREGYLARTSSADLWSKRLEAARALLAEGYADEALEVLRVNNEGGSAERAPTAELREQVESISLAATRIKTRAELSVQSTVERVMRPFREILPSMVLIIALVLLVWAGVRTWAFFSGTRTYLWIEDLSTDDKKPEDLTQINANLSARLAQAITALNAGHYRFSDESEALPEVESTVALAQPGQTADQVIAVDAPFKVAALTINLGPILKWLNNHLTPRAYADTYRGSLRRISDAHGYGCELYVQGCVKGERKHYHAYARVTDTGISKPDNTKKEIEKAVDRLVDDLIEDVAAQIAAGVSGPMRVTESASSLLHYVRGMSLLEGEMEGHIPAIAGPQIPTELSLIAEGRAQSHPLQRAIEEFRRALSCDADNWLAQYYLGYTFMRAGRYLDAAAQFDGVARKLTSLEGIYKNTGRWPNRRMASCRVATAGMRRLHDYSRDVYPHLPSLLTLRANMARARADDEEALKLAVSELSKLESDLTATIESRGATAPAVTNAPSMRIGDGSPHNPGPDELLRDGRAVQLVALSRCFEKGIDLPRPKGEGTEKRIMDLWTALEQDFANPGLFIPSDVRATACTGYGWYLQSAGRHDDARKRLWHAIELQKGIRDPLPYLLLARIYKQGAAQLPRWHDKALYCLDAALRLKPGDSHTMLEIARLHLESGSIEDALRWAKAAGESFDSLSLQLQIYAAAPPLVRDDESFRRLGKLIARFSNIDERQRGGFETQVTQIAEILREYVLQKSGSDKRLRVAYLKEACWYLPQWADRSKIEKDLVNAYRDLEQHPAIETRSGGPTSEGAQNQQPADR